MADKASISRVHQEILRDVVEILERRDPDAPERITRGHLPSAAKDPLGTALFHAECMRSLSRIVDEQLTPKKRGRPPKVTS